VAANRRLAAIMFTDIVGSTTLAQSDEAEALRLQDEQERLVRPLFAAHQGREIKSMGDGFLAEFDSALRAVQCAVDIQQRLHERNSQSGRSPLLLRIGIHLGDVEVRGTDIFGDSVNVASRIEPLAEPGGICVTEPVFGQVRNKIPNRLEKLAPQVLKNVRHTFDIYRVVMPWREEGPPSTNRGPRGLAVLPFANISPDPGDEYFADGLTEELITVLSQVGELRVIARTSVTPYRSTSKGVSQIGEELGVSSILEGSVRKAGNRLRITVQLIDVVSQGHVWAQTYDRELDDIFALQSEIAKQVAEALKVKLLAREEARLDRRALPRPDSYLEYLRGRTRMHDFSEVAMRASKEHFERAIQLDDRNAAAHAGLADVTRFLGGMFRHLPQPEWEAVSREHAARAIELDPELAEAHASLALILLEDYEYREAEREFQLTLSLNPSLAWARTFYADLLADQGRSEEALREFALAEELDPLSTVTFGEEIQFLVILRRLDVAASRLEKLGRVENFGLLYHNCRFSLCLARGDVEQGLQEIDALSELLPGRPEIGAGYALHLASVGKEERARELLRPMESLPEPIRPDSQIAAVYARLGDLDACYHWLDVAVAVKRLSPRLWRLDPSLSHVRGDPRFQVLLKKMNLA
jgi:adenylate cyclase